MSKLPYFQPDKDLFLNISICILIIHSMAITKRGKKVLTIDKLQTFYFLIMRPFFLNKVLNTAGKPQIYMEKEEYYTVDTLSINVDELFNRKKIKELLKILSVKKLVNFTYDKKEGFLIELNENGIPMLDSLDENYHFRVKRYLEGLSSLQSESSSKLNGYINQILKQG